MFTDEMEEAIDKVQEFIDKIREIGSKKVLAVMPDLEEWLDNLLRASEKAMKSRELEEQTAKEHFELYHRRLTGISEEFTALARKQPESRCNPFKLEQVNQILRPLKEELEAYLGEPLSLADGDAALTYSDVSLLLRNYLDLSDVYAPRRYHQH